MKAELKDITIHYAERGDGRPLIVLHGWGLDHRHLLGPLEPIFERRSGWRRLYVDLPGHGRTPAKDDLASQDRLLDVMLEFIDVVAPGERFVVAGSSAGAYLARGIVLRRADVMDGLLLVIPMIVAEDARRILPKHVTLVKDDALRAQLTLEQAGAFDAMAVVQNRTTFENLTSPPPPPEAAGDEAFKTLVRNDPKRYAFSFGVDALQQPFPAPTLIVAGRQDSVVGYRQAWDIIENYPRATFAVLDRAGHFLEREQGGLLGPLVSEWLDRVEEYRP